MGPDDGTDTPDTDSGKRPTGGNEGGTMLGDPDGGIDNGDSGDTSDGGAQIDTGSQSNCSAPFNGVLATYDFTNEPGNQASTPAKSTAPSVTAGNMDRSNTITPVTGLNSINSSNWTTSSKIDTTRYYAFTIAPPAGCALDINQVSIDTKTSSTGPVSGSLATSDDNFGQQSNVALNSVAKASVSVSGSTNKVEVRVYGFAASSTSGTWRIQNTLTVSGALK